MACCRTFCRPARLVDYVRRLAQRNETDLLKTMIKRGIKSSREQRLCLILWPLIFIIVCLDLDVLDAFDILFLACLTAVASWGILTKRWLVRLPVALLLLFLSAGPIFGGVYLLRSVLTESSRDAIIAFRMLQPIRPYTLTAILGLFFMALSPPPRSEASRKSSGTDGSAQ